MPRQPTVFDMVEHHLHGALEAMRMAPIGSLEHEQIQTQVYHHVNQALEVIVKYAYRDPHYRQEGSSLPSPSGRRRGGGDGRTDRGRSVDPGSLVEVRPGLKGGIAVDLDLIKRT